MSVSLFLSKKQYLRENVIIDFSWDIESLNTELSPIEALILMQQKHRKTFGQFTLHMCT